MNEILEKKINLIIESELSIFSSEQIYSNIIDIALSWSSGKKIRSKITQYLLLSNTEEKNNQKYEVAASICATIELIHMATLMHDDVIDNNDTRRNSRTASKYLGNKCSVLIGDLLLATALKIISKLNNSDLIISTINASNEIIRGEILQTSSHGDVEMTTERYIEIISKKTSSLIIAACELSAIAKQFSEKEKENIISFGKYFGISFQIIDDILDYIGDTKITKKTQGQDFINKTITLPAIMAIAKSNDAESKFWHNYKYKNNAEMDFSKALKLINKYNGIQKAKDIAFIYREKARECISYIKNRDFNKDLIKLIDESLFLQSL